MEELEQDARDLRLAEQEIFRQTLEEKTTRLTELEAEVRYLRRTLNDMLAVRVPQPQLAPATRTTAPTGTTGHMPRRWRAA
jgi:hypothetical protein